MNLLATIITYPVKGSASWFHANGEYKGILYTADMATRHQAFCEVARMIAVRMEEDDKEEELKKPL